MPRMIRALPLLLVAACATLPAVVMDEPPIAPYDVALGVATFDSAWARVNAQHYDTTFGGLDWRAVRTELRPRAEQARSKPELRAVINDMIARLGVSHYTLIPGELSDDLTPTRRSTDGDGAPADAGVELRMAADSSLVAWRVDTAGAAAAAGLQPGAQLLRIDAFDAQHALQRVRELADARDRHLALTRYLYAVNALLRGSVGDTVTLVTQHAGDVMTHHVVLRPATGQVVRFGNLPPTLVRVQSERITVPEGCIGVVSFSTWMGPVAAQVDRAVDEYRNCHGLVLDLRGNPGGVAGMVMGIGGHFIDSTRALGTMNMRGTELRYVVNPRRVNAKGESVPVYAGRVAILVDVMSASTSEIFAAGLQALDRARVFGEVSAGQALPAVAGKLPNGDVLMQAVADYTVVDGTRVEGRGVVPDEFVPLTRAAAESGRDEVMEAAIRWMRIKS